MRQCGKRGHIIRRTRFACRITKARDTSRIYKTYCLSTATMVARTRYNATYTSIYVQYIVRLVVDQRHDGPCDVACLDDLSCLLTAPVCLLTAINIIEIPPTLHLQGGTRLM
jgi:hypothetical protein